MADIVVLKKDLITLAKIANAVDKALEDGKVSVPEGIGLAFKAIDIIAVIKSIKQAKEEIIDLTQEEIDELSAAFAAEFDLSNDKAEEVVETIISLVFAVLQSLDVLKQ